MLALGIVGPLGDWVACEKRVMRPSCPWPSRVMFWVLVCCPYRLQHCGAPEGHSTPTSARSCALCQQAAPWLLWPSTQPSPSLCPQHYHHKSVSVAGCLALCPWEPGESALNLEPSPKLKPPPPGLPNPQTQADTSATGLPGS